MTVTLSSTGLVFGDSTVQTTKFDTPMDGGPLISINSFTASGTWTRPSGCTRVLVKVIGGGGGGAGYCESGGGGGYAEQVVDVTAISSVAVTVGGAGGGVGYYAAGGGGGTSSFGSFCSATGGAGANSVYTHTGGHGGVGSLAAVNLYGGDGSGHSNHAGHFPSGTGGGTYLGGSSTINRDTTSSKLNVGAPGTGGPGGRTDDGGAGNVGETGMVIVYNYGGRSGTLGSTSALAASSAQAILADYPEAADGVYWINLPTVGATQVYCLMRPEWNGGGWMMMMKATRGTTFTYGASYWTTNNTLNPTDITRNDGDAKYNVMNYFAAKDMLAVFPDIGDGGSIPNMGRWTWLQNSFYGGTAIVPITFWSGNNRRFIQDAKTFSGWRGDVWSSQTDIRFYGYNWTDNLSCRWGFGWNENGGGLYPNGVEGSDDVSGGIGTNYSSCGDQINCCQDNTGMNRTARVEIYVR